MAPMIEMLNNLAGSWSGALLRATWQGGLAITAAWVLVRSRPGLPPRVACWVWRLADLKLIVAFLWATPLLLPLLSPLSRAEPFPETIASTALAPNPAGESGATVISAGEPNPTPESCRPILACGAFIFWLSGIFGAAIMAGREGLVVCRLRKACQPIASTDLQAAASDLARVLGLLSVPELRVGPVVTRPMVVGAFRPAILLPAGMLRDSRLSVAIRPVLAHELAHVGRGDLLWSGLAGLVRALFFFHPLVWLAHREALLAREAACDALALRASGVCPSDYGRILLDIAAGCLEQPTRSAATLGMAGSASSIKLRLMAMKTIQQPSRRRLQSWAFTLLVVGAAGIIPWQLVPRGALAQNPSAVPPAKQPGSDPKDGRASAAAESTQAWLKLTEARLLVAQAERKVDEDLLKQAEAEVAQAAAMREYQGKQRNRIAQLANKNAIEPTLVDEHELRFREAQAAERAAEAKIAVSRFSLEAGQAAIREAEALRDIARAESRIAPDAEKPHRAPAPPAARADGESQFKGVRARLHEARRDRARAESDAARAEIDRAEANLQKAKATVEFRTKEVERFKQLASRQAIEHRLVDEREQVLSEARNAEREAEVVVQLARARLKVAEARLKATEAEVSAANRRPIEVAP